MELETMRVIDAEDGIVELRLQRTDGGPNHFVDAVLADLELAFNHLYELPRLDALLITAEGPNWMAEMPAAECRRLLNMPEADLRKWAEAKARVLRFVEDLHVPSICVIDGKAFGAGLDLALITDLRVATPSSQFGFTEQDLGFMPAFMGPWRMSAVAGLPAALEWSCTGSVYNAAKAQEIGLVHLAEPDQLRARARALLAPLLDGDELQKMRTARLGRPPIESAPDIACHVSDARQMVTAHMGPHIPSVFETIAALEESVRLKRDRAVPVWARRFAVATRTTAADAILSLSAVADDARNRAYQAHRRVPPGPVALIGPGLLSGALSFSLSRHADVYFASSSETVRKESRIEFKRRLKLRLDRAQMSEAEVRLSLDRYHEINADEVPTGAAVVDLREDRGPAPRRHDLMFSDVADAKRYEAGGDSAAFAGFTVFPAALGGSLALITMQNTTSTEQLFGALAVAFRMNRIPILARPTPAGVVHRVFLAGVMGFEDLLHHGVRFEHADLLLRNDGWAKGIGQIVDALDPDALRYRIGLLAQAYPKRFKVPYASAVQTLLDKARSFYQRDGAIDSTSAALLNNARVGKERTYSSSEVVSHIVNPMILEAIRCVDEGLVSSGAHLNLAMVTSGLMPRQRGGPLKRLEAIGHRALIEWGEKNAELGDLSAIPKSLRAKAIHRDSYC